MTNQLYILQGRYISFAVDMEKIVAYALSVHTNPEKDRDKNDKIIKLTFSDKIKAFQKLLKDLYPDDFIICNRETPLSLIANLEKIRKLRNRFAHEYFCHPLEITFLDDSEEFSPIPGSNIETIEFVSMNGDLHLISTKEIESIIKLRESVRTATIQVALKHKI